MKKLPIKEQITQILKRGIPNPNDEWSDGKYDTKEVLKYMSRLLERKLEEAYVAGKESATTDMQFITWMETEGIQKVKDEKKTIYYI
jgi:hypothetical protein